MAFKNGTELPPARERRERDRLALRGTYLWAQPVGYANRHERRRAAAIKRRAKR